MSKKKQIPAQYLPAIKKIYKNQAGTVAYVQRVVRYDIRAEKEYVTKSQTVAQINQQAFYKREKNGGTSRKTPYEVWEMLDSTRQDLGASYMLIN